MTTYTYDHIHLRSRDPMATAQYFNKMFDAKILESVQSDGQPRIDLDVNGLMIFIAKADETDVAAVLEFAGNRVEYRFYCLASIPLADPRLVSDGSNKLVLIHRFFPFGI